MSTVLERRETTKLLDKARKLYKLATEADEDQRTRERADLAFYGGDQWPAEVKTARKAQPAGQDGTPAIPARPCLTINKVRQPVSIVTNQERQSQIGVTITPADDWAGLVGAIDDTEIELREGLVRRIQRESDAQAARAWAFSRATISGRGYYAVMTRYLPGKTSDQEVYLHRIYNQDAVRMDPAHEESDGSDCDWQFMGAWVPLTTYKALYPSSAAKRNRISAAATDDFKAWADDEPDWVKQDQDDYAIFVVDYYYFDHKARSLSTFADGSAEWTADIADDDPREVVDTRSVDDKQAKWCKLDGLNDEPLEETDWPSPWLPILKVLGEELHPWDQERRAEGMVRPMRDSGEGFNAMASKLVEVVAYAPIPPIIMVSGADENYEDEWDLSTTRSIGRLHYNLVMGENGQMGPPPQATPRDAPIAPIAAALQMFDAGVKSTTGVPDPTLGNVDPALKSGRAIDRLNAQSRMGTSTFMANLGKTVRHEGRIVNSLLWWIYGQRPGRLVRLITGEGDMKPVVVGQPPMQPGMPMGMPPPMGQPQQKVYRLTKDAQFNVNVKVTKSYDTRREQQNDFIESIVSADPSQLLVVGDLFYGSMEDMPAHKDMAARAKVMLAPPVQQMLKAKENGQAPLPPEIQQQLQQAQEGTKALLDRVKELEAKIEGKVVEQQGKIELEAMKLSAQSEEKAKDRETKLAVAELGAKVDRLQLFLEERARLGAERHETALAGAQAGHEDQMARIGAMHDSMAAGQDHDQAMEQQQQAAALAPPPQAPA